MTKLGGHSSISKAEIFNHEQGPEEEIKNFTSAALCVSPFRRYKFGVINTSLYPVRIDI